MEVSVELALLSSLVTQWAPFTSNCIQQGERGLREGTVWDAGEVGKDPKRQATGSLILT